MMNKKVRNWQVAFPLAITSLCVAPQSYFLKHWQSFFEASVPKLKVGFGFLILVSISFSLQERSNRVTILNGLLRLVWTYLYRCQESASTTMAKLETLLKHFFPSNRNTVSPSDDHPEPLIYMMHFILSRHPDYGRELCLELIQEPSINNLQQKSGSIGNVLAHERTAIAINAVLLSLHNTEREVLTPTWPSSSDFSVVPAKEDYPSSSAYIPPNILKPGMQEFLNRCAGALASIAIYSGKSVAHMSVFDDQWSVARLTAAYEESNNFIIRRHADGIAVAYPAQSHPHIQLLHTSFQAWPRLLHPSITLIDSIDLLLHGVVHVEPSVADAARSALKRFMQDDANAIQVISQFNHFVFSPSRICYESSSKLLVEYSPLLALWINIIEDWIKTIIRRGIDAFVQVEEINAKCTEVEAAALFLLAHESTKIHSDGVKIIRLLGQLSPLLSSSSSNLLYIVERLQGKRPGLSYLNGYDELLDKSEQSRLDQWRKFKGDEVALRIVDSGNEKDRKLWRYVFPAFLQDCVKHSPTAVGLLREGIVASVSRYHPSISYLAGLSSRMPPGLSSRNALERDGFKLVLDNKAVIDQWHIWVKILSATAMPPDSSRPALTKLGRDHTRAPSDVSFERERYFTTRGLFRHLTPFLDSEYALFRDAAVLCISSFPANAYPQLLEDLSLLAGRQPYDDPRSKIVATPGLDQNFGILSSRQMYEENRSRSGSSAVLTDRSRRQERLHSAVAQIYYITVHLLEQQRSSARQAALSNILKFVRNTQGFLSAPELRDIPSLQRLRRYFCGIVEHLFNELATLKDSDRFIPSSMHLTLYRLCEEWCHVGPQSESSKKRLDAMQKAVESSDASSSRENLQRFRYETATLSHASVGAMTALCVSNLLPPNLS